LLLGAGAVPVSSTGVSNSFDGLPWQLGCNYHSRRSLTEYFAFRVLLVVVGQRICD
jgi:hypothetical protein